MPFDFGGLLQGVGAIANTFMGQSQAKKNVQMQQEFAQKGIQWKVKDAKKAGIHPLYALGAQTTSFSPVSVGSDLASAGQGIGRAIASTSTHAQRVDQVTGRAAELQLTGMELDNARKAAELKLMTQPATPPGNPGLFPSTVLPGQGDTTVDNGMFVRKPQVTETSMPDKPSITPAAVPGVTFERTPDGSYAAIPSRTVKEQIEDIGPLGWQWWVRHHGRPSATGAQEGAPPKSWLPKGADHWRMDAFQGVWRPAIKSRWGAGFEYTN